MLICSPVTAKATVFTNTTVASFGSVGAGACRGAAVGIAGYEAGQVVTAHPTGTVESGWDGRLQVTAVPGPAGDQVGYKVCNVGTATVSSPAPQAILLASISADSGQSTATVEKDFGSIAAHACASSTESVPGAQTSAAVTAQPNGAIASQYGATGGLPRLVFTPMRLAQRFTSGGALAVTLGWVVALAFAGSTEVLLFLAPALLILVPLLGGHYVGEELIERLAARGGRARRRAGGLPVLSLPLAPERWLPRGAALISFSLAKRPPPLRLLTQN
ncbi:MAG TPA: hypothetical protein VFT10_03250 [Solirubrobacterales bacterium]|nr:hypothetical protein [Solirubrobacterales bacterium]